MRSAPVAALEELGLVGPRNKQPGSEAGRPRPGAGGKDGHEKAHAAVNIAPADGAPDGYGENDCMFFLLFYVSTGQPHRSLIALERRLSCSKSVISNAAPKSPRDTGWITGLLARHASITHRGAYTKSVIEHIVQPDPKERSPGCPSRLFGIIARYAALPVISRTRRRGCVHKGGKDGHSQALDG